MKRPAPWQLEKQRTAKAMREYPKCSTEGCENSGRGYLHELKPGGVPSRWLCVKCAAETWAEKRRQNLAGSAELSSASKT